MIARSEKVRRLQREKDFFLELLSPVFGDPLSSSVTFATHNFCRGLRLHFTSVIFLTDAFAQTVLVARKHGDWENKATRCFREPIWRSKWLSAKLNFSLRVGGR